MFCYTVFPVQLDWIKLDAKRDNKLKHFSQNNIQLIEAPIHDHRAIGLVERLIQTIKNRLAGH